jgi:hypothetical protein
VQVRIHVSGSDADNETMGEVMSLTVAAVASMAGFGCVLAARTPRAPRWSAASAPDQRAFAVAAALAFAGLPALALDAAGLLTPATAVLVLLLLSCACACACAGRTLALRALRAAHRRMPVRSPRLTVVPTELHALAAVGAGQRERRLSAPVLVAVIGDGCDVELNLN